MFRYLVMLAGLLLTGSLGFAQKKDSSSIVEQMNFPNEWTVKFAPLSIFDTDGGINFSGEYLVSKQRIGYQLEAQAILFNVYRDDDADGFNRPLRVLQSGLPHGIKLRPEVRYYLEGLKLSKRPPRPGSRRYGLDPETRRRLQNRTYIALDFLYKQVRKQRINEFDIYNGNTQPVFEQRAVYTDVKQVTGFDFKLGVVGPAAGEHWLTDFYIGVGVRYKKFWYRNIPTGASAPAREEFSIFGNNRSTSSLSEAYPSFPFGIKITYRF